MSAARENDPVPVYLGLGSNIEPERNLPDALALLERHLPVAARSTVWETPPVGATGPDFLNAVLLVYSEMPLDALRDELLRPVEAALGRVRSTDPNAPRTIDLDILIFDSQVLEPEIWVQAYWSVPLSELVPECVNPETGETVQQAAERLAKSIAILPRRDVIL